MAFPVLPLSAVRLGPRAWLSRLLVQRQGGVLIFQFVFLAVASLTRLALFLKAGADAPSQLPAVGAFGIGLAYDCGAALLASIPLVLVLALLPAGWGTRGWQRFATHLAGTVILFVLLFGSVTEWMFWDEFGARFNFIAVDYLVYTTEVVRNIHESYNVAVIVAAVFFATLLAGLLVLATGWPQRWLGGQPQPARARWRSAAMWLAVAGLAGGTLSEAALPTFANNYHRELAKNGLWSLFAAFRNNVLEYDQFYRTMPPQQAYARLQQELVEDGSILLRPGTTDTLRYVKNDGPECRVNVIQITVESLSANFLGAFNHASKLTPNLDALAARSLVFENFYATGTRTDRGMEALTLSLPPTPGRSLVKRPHNEDLFTLGSVFRAKGYDTAFLYGGYGYFDNMNSFFGQNGYRVVDRNSVTFDDVTFANAWGACDEDLLRWTLREADTSHATGRPFHYFVMTTSNHRPYTYPEGRIDLPSKVSGRAGAVKYTDHAIGEFLRAAATRPWYRDTVFVIVADHCASCAGRTEIPVENYHIPLMIFSPGGQVNPGTIATLTSQMDFAPTLLGLLNWSYPSRFFGHDVRRIAPHDAHALVGNYQKLGHLENNEFVVLKPDHGCVSYVLGASTSDLTPSPPTRYAQDEAVSFYAAASYAYQQGLYRSLTAEEFTCYSVEGERFAAEISRKAKPLAAAAP